jgi:hypothetical protein
LADLVVIRALVVERDTAGMVVVGGEEAVVVEGGGDEDEW